MAAILSPKTFSASDWLDDVVAAPWVWGVNDCTMSVADYVHRLTDRDPAKRFRGRYASGLAARRIWKRRGGFLPMIREEMEGAGFETTTVPVHGDVGIVIATDRFRTQLPVIGTVSAVRVGTLWAVRAAAGVVAQDFEMIAAWSMAPWIQS